MSPSRRTVRAATTATLAAALLTIPGSPAYAEACVGGVNGDFNGDGVKDIAIGDAFGHINGMSAGKVIIRYGGTDLRQEISQDSVGVPGAAEEGDLFGLTLASYDHNRDGCADLVVGAPDEALGSRESAGMVIVIPGSPNGLYTHVAFSLHQDSPGMPGAAETNDRFGQSLAAGHTRTGEPFLAIGVPDETIGSGTGSAHGAFHYMRGSVNVLIHQNDRGVPGGNESLDFFGTTLVATRDHIVVGTPAEDLVVNGRNAGNAGAIHIFSHQFTSTGSPRWARMIHQGVAGVSGALEAGDLFGGGGGGFRAEGGLSAVAYRPSGVSDSEAGSLIAVGVPGEDLGPHNHYSNAGHGWLHLFYVSRSGGFSQIRTLHQDTAGVGGGTEPEDLFGADILLFGNRGNEALGPQTTSLLVAVRGERAGGAYGAFQLFSLAGDPGNADVWIGHGHFGLSYLGGRIGSNMGITETDLYLEGPSWWEVTVVPWANIRDGADRPVGSVRSSGETGGLVGVAME